MQSKGALLSASLTLHNFTANSSVGERFLVLEYKGVERISEPFRYDIHCIFYYNVFNATRSNEFFNALDTTQATLALSSPVNTGAAGIRSIRGYISDYETLNTYLDPAESSIRNKSVRSPYDSYSILRITVRPLFALLDQTTYFRAFIGQTTRQIVEFLLSELNVSVVDTETFKPVGRYLTAANASDRLKLSDSTTANMFFNKRLRFVLQNYESSLNLISRLLDECGLYFVVQGDTDGEVVRIRQYDEAFDNGAFALTAESSVVNGQDRTTLLTRSYRQRSVPIAVEVISVFPGDPSNPVYAQRSITEIHKGLQDAVVVDNFPVDRFILESGEQTREQYKTYVDSKLNYEYARYNSDNFLYDLLTNNYLPVTGLLYAITSGGRNISAAVINQEVSGRTHHFVLLRNILERITTVLSQDVLTVRNTMISSGVHYLPEIRYVKRPANLSVTGYIHSVPEGTTYTSIADWTERALPTTDGRYAVVVSDLPLIYGPYNTNAEFNASQFNFSNIYSTPVNATATIPQLNDAGSLNANGGMQFLLHNGTHVSVEFIDGHPDLPFIAGVMSSPVINQQETGRNEYEDNMRFDSIYQMQTKAGNLLRMNTAVSSPSVELRSPVSVEQTVTATSGSTTLTMNRLQYSNINIVGGTGPAAAYLSAETTGVSQKIVLGGQQRNVIAVSETMSSQYDGYLGFVQALHPVAVLEGYNSFPSQPLKAFYASTAASLDTTDNPLLSYPSVIASDSEFEGNFLVDRDVGDVYRYQQGVRYTWHNQNNLYRRGCFENIYFSSISPDQNALSDQDIANSFAATNSGKSIGVLTDKGKTNSDRYYIDHFRHVWGDTLFASSGPVMQEVYGEHNILTDNGYAYAQRVDFKTKGDINISTKHTHTDKQLFVMREEQISRKYMQCARGMHTVAQMDDVFYFPMNGTEGSGVYLYANAIGTDSAVTAGLHLNLATTADMEFSTYHGANAILDSVGIISQMLSMAIKIASLPAVGAFKVVGKVASAISMKNGVRIGSPDASPPPSPPPA